MLKLIATWNTARTVWETSQRSLLCGHSVPFSQAWTTSGTLRNGQAYERATSALRTAESAFSYLPTPIVSDGTGGPKDLSKSVFAPQIRDIANLLPTPTVAHLRNHDEAIENYESRVQQYKDGELRGKPGVSLGVEVRREFFPTPVASEGSKAPAQQSSEEKKLTGQVWLSNVAKDVFLLGTPRVSSSNGSTQKQVNGGAPKARLEDQVLLRNWGKYGPAIELWENVLGIPAPEPTKPDGRDNGHRLNAEFAEWLMGIPGRLDGVELTRTERLKMAGNGVCPQQAYAAFSELLERIK